MMTIRCTAKVLKELKIAKSQVPDHPESAGALAEWYVHLFYLNRRKCLMFTNSGTLFSFVVAGVACKDIQNLPEFFRKELSKALFYEEFSSEQIQEIMKPAEQVIIARTNNRSVLASMNQMTFEYESTVWKYQHLGKEEVIMANRELNRMLRGAIGRGRHDYGVPIERFKELVGVFRSC